MKTNNKLHPVNAYLMAAISDNLKEDYSLEKEPGTDQEKLQFVLDCFRAEAGYNIKRVGKHQALKDWFAGLPSVIHVDFENYKILKLAIAWESIPADATESQEDKILGNWFNFIAVKFLQLCKRNKVN